MNYVQVCKLKDFLKTTFPAQIMRISRDIRYTVLRFQDFSTIQILREINFGQFTSSKTAIFGALNFVDLVNFTLKKVQNA